MSSVLSRIEQEQQRRELSFRPGDQVRVHVRIVEGDKERIQVFEGVVIGIRGTSSRRSFTVRKVSYGVGVERVFPLQSPSIEKIAVVMSGKVRRGKLYYLRQLSGKAARLKERDTRTTGGAAAAAAAAAAATAAAASATTEPSAEA